MPGMGGSHVRVVRATGDDPGLAFYPWGNFRRLERPDMPSLTLEFRKNGSAFRQVWETILEPGPEMS